MKIRFLRKGALIQKSDRLELYFYEAGIIQEKTALNGFTEIRYLIRFMKPLLTLKDMPQI